MALDADGRPIPVRIPNPKEMVAGHGHGSGEISPSQEQLMIAQRKADDALRAAAEIAERMRLLEQKVDAQLPAKLAELDQRFNDMMLARLKESQHQVDEVMRSVERSMRAFADEHREAVAAATANIAAVAAQPAPPARK